jgi:hypothetical protein
MVSEPKPITTSWLQYLTPADYTCVMTFTWWTTTRLHVSFSPPWRLRHSRLVRGVWTFCYYVWGMRVNQTVYPLGAGSARSATFRWPRWAPGSSRWIRLQCQEISKGVLVWRNRGPIMQIYIPPGPEPAPCNSQMVYDVPVPTPPMPVLYHEIVPTTEPL